MKIGAPLAEANQYIYILCVEGGLGKREGLHNLTKFKIFMNWNTLKNVNDFEKKALELMKKV